MQEAPQDSFGLAGTVLEGQYRVDAVIGEGGFGVVYRGRHLSLDQPIAIKVLKGLDGGDRRINDLILDKFRTEARLLYTLSQSSLHIVRALDFGAATMPSGVWAPFMILEWLDGRSLAEDLDDRARRGIGGRSVPEALAILGPVADGLAVAHRQQVAHRDVKPANIFLLGSGQAGPHVKVLDFGIAKIMKEGEAAGTKGTFASFTWLYAAPEQLDPRVGKTGLETDVYAFALLVTQLLSGRQPIDEHDVVGIMRASTDRARRPTPRTRGANVTDAIEAVCQRALAIEPQNRYPSIIELWAALGAAQKQRSSTTAQAVMAPPSVVMAPMSVPQASTRPSYASPQPSQPQPSHPQPSQPQPSHPQPSQPQPSRPQPSQMMQSQAAPSAPAGVGPPRGTRPPGFLPTPPPTSLNHVNFGGPMTPYAPSPPRGTAPPGFPRLPFVRADGGTSTVVLTIVFFMLALLLAGSCAAVHACIG